MGDLSREVVLVTRRLCPAVVADLQVMCEGNERVLVLVSSILGWHLGSTDDCRDGGPTRTIGDQTSRWSTVVQHKPGDANPHHGHLRGPSNHYPVCR